MNHEDYSTLLTDALARNETVSFSCNCTIRYSGRAESFLDWGDRLVIIKSDNALIIHQPAGNAPINYMKPNTGYVVALEDDKLHLKCQNLAQKERMHLIIDKIHFFNSHKLQDGQAILISGTEEDMSDMIYNNPELIEKGFRPVSREEQTQDGFVDVMGVDKEGAGDQGWPRS